MHRPEVKWPLVAVVLLVTLLGFRADWVILPGIDSAGAAEISYVYDELGRLKAVIDPAADTAVYNYDAVGNVTSISRQSSSVVSIIEFTPKEGPIGTIVTISGTGFSATPSQNTVTFNGASATVSSSTETKIIATVPAGATTGPIAVTSPAGSATSSAAFTVASSNAPTITGFTPTIGPVGTPITVTGTNFDPTASKNQLRVNIRATTAGAATVTSISTAMPSATASGRISVSTIHGKAVSAADFFIPPVPYTASDVQHTGRMTAGGASHTVTLSTANKIALVVFDGLVNQKISLQMASVTFGWAYISIVTPANTTLATTATGPAGNFLDDVTLPMSGTYTIFVDPQNTFTGSMNLTLQQMQDVTGTITPDGPPVTVTTTVAGQNARLRFNATAGQQFGLGITNVVGGGMHVSVLKFDGTTLINSAWISSNNALDFQIPATGVYTILANPPGATPGSMTFTLSQDVDAGAIVVDGSSVAVSIPRPGQKARLTFNGTSGQQLGMGMTNIVGGGMHISVLKPDGSALITTAWIGESNSLDFQVPTTGTYTIIANPPAANTGSMIFTLSQDIDAGPITIGGSPVTVSIPRPGQKARLTFSGTANQRISLQMTNVTYGWATVSILNPNQTTLVSIGLGTQGGFIEPVTLPSAGTYTILINPQGAITGNMTLSLYDVSQDFVATITPGGPSVTVTTSIPGQIGRVTFDGVANQKVSLRMTSVTYGWATVSILRPNQTTLVSIGLGTQGGFIEPVSLPSTGTYTILVDPQTTLTGNMTLSLYDVVDVTGTVSVGGSSLPVSITSPGQRAILTFDGTGGQQITVRMTGNTIPWVTVQLKKPDGSQLTASSSGSASFNLSTQTLPSTGTYTIVVDPQATFLGSQSVSVTTP